MLWHEGFPKPSRQELVWANRFDLLATPPVKSPPLGKLNNQHTTELGNQLTINPAGQHPLGWWFRFFQEITMNEMIKVPVCTAPLAALDWAIAKARGRALRDAVNATHEDVAHLTVPFVLYEVVGIYNGEGEAVNASVVPITVERYGINAEAGATAPSITYRENGRRANGSVQDFYLTKEEAEIEVKTWIEGGLHDYSPTTNWALMGPIIHEAGIAFQYQSKTSLMAYLGSEGTAGACGTGENHLIAAARCYLVSVYGQTIEVPQELARALEPMEA